MYIPAFHDLFKLFIYMSKRFLVAVVDKIFSFDNHTACTVKSAA